MESLYSVLPHSWLATFVFVFGVIIGSFLNVYLYRFHTGRTVLGSSHCLSCGNSLSAFELIPLLSYLCLQGRCRNCSSSIPSRYFLVELLTGLLFLGSFLVATDVISLLLALGVMVLLVLVAVYDIYHMVIPDEFVLALTALAALKLLYLLIGGLSIYDFSLSIAAALTASAFLLTLWLLSKGTWIGFGDVKLILPLGLLVGPGQVFSLVVLAFWIGAGVGLLLLLVQKLQRRNQQHLRLLQKELTMRSAVPFAPFLILGYLAVYFWGIDVIALLTYV